MQTLNRNSMLIAAVPRKRGTPAHYETGENGDGDVAGSCLFEGDKVTTIVTPPTIPIRVHEAAMHANHTSPRRAKRQYAGVRPIVANIVEDVRIHLLHWPWPYRQTPETIAKPTRELIEQEYTDAANADPKHGPWPPFARRLRAYAMQKGMDGWCDSPFEDKHEARLAYQIEQLINKKHEGMAARLLETAFFPPPPDVELPPLKGKPIQPKSERGSRTNPKMEVIELQHTVPITDAEIGSRPCVSGPRVDRRALRRPIEPVRRFIRRAPIEPGGTILIDASGSMGDFEQVRQWCEVAPFATVAYYAGCDNGAQGWLYVYARDGYRAHEVVEPPVRGNLVDGPALDWLMRQDGPRIMVTDREFCGAHDSYAQRCRLMTLESLGEITVADYRKKKDAED